MPEGASTLISWSGRIGRTRRLPGRKLRGERGKTGEDGLMEEKPGVELLLEAAGPKQ